MDHSQTDRIWRLLHEELDDQEAQALTAELAGNDERVQGFQSRNELDLILRDALGAQATQGVTAEEAVPSEEVGARPGGRLIVFPLWRRVAQVAAVFVVVAGVVGLLRPVGPLQWKDTEIVLLENSRGPDVNEGSALDVSAVDAVCEELKSVVGGRYEETVGPGDSARWQMRVRVTEHAGGAFEVQVEARRHHTAEYQSIAEQRYADVSAFSRDVQGLARTISRALRQDRQAPAGEGRS